ncbi:MAG: glycosyltransferase [Pseudonocardiales bacterium]|nr:glycosyltransferase [Pseudonocardiales bacterium]
MSITTPPPTTAGTGRRHPRGRPSSGDGVAAGALAAVWCRSVGPARRWSFTSSALPRRPGRGHHGLDHLGRTDLSSAVYVEHNAPRGDVPYTRHPMADRSDIPVVHVTPFNELFWDSGRAPTVVIEHGIPDPGHRYTGELDRAAVVINEPVRRSRVTGTDLLSRFAAQAPLDVFGMVVSELASSVSPELNSRAVRPARDSSAVELGRDSAVDGPGSIRTFEHLPQAQLFAELARRRVYLHPIRWTSLGLSLLEAMHLGMPVVALATTEVVEAVPPQAGVVSTRVEVLIEAFALLPQRSRLRPPGGTAARAAARARYSMDRFLTDWEQLLKEMRR